MREPSTLTKSTGGTFAGLLVGDLQLKIKKQTKQNIKNFLTFILFTPYQMITWKYHEGKFNFRESNAKKKLPDNRKPSVSYDGFEPSTHALKGRCSTY